MTRIVAGVAGGRRLAVPRAGGTRPTSYRAREGLFSTLEALLGSLSGRRVADLYAGTGAVGLEALSRGAPAVLLVESDQRTAAVARANARAVGLPGAQVLTVTVERTVAAPPPGGPYDVVFLDPPYATPARTIEAVLDALVANRWLEPGGVVVVERATRAGPPAWTAGLQPARVRRYGEATLWYGRAASA